MAGIPAKEAQTIETLRVEFFVSVSGHVGNSSPRLRRFPPVSATTVNGASRCDHRWLCLPRPESDHPCLDQARQPRRVVGDVRSSNQEGVGGVRRDTPPMPALALSGSDEVRSSICSRRR